MDRHHHFHIIKHLHFPQALHDRFKDLVIADSFRLLALSIISIFIPIYLLDKVGLSLQAVAAFELGSYILSIFLHYAFIRLCGSWGVKKVMIASYLFNIIGCSFLYYGNEALAALGFPVFLSIVILLNAVPLSMYWSAHHIYFLESIKDSCEGRKLGILSSIPMIISIAGPFIGSLLISFYSYREVFLFSIILLMIASLALSFSEEIRIKTTMHWKNIIDTDNFRKNAIFFLQGLGYAATGFIWPALLFFASIKLMAIGFFYLLSNFLNGIIVFLGGCRVDKEGAERIIRIGAIGHSVSIIMRALSTTMLFMATFQSMGGIFGGLLHVAIDTNFYKRSHDRVGDAVMNRELYMHLGRMTAVASLFVALIFFPAKIALAAVLVVSGFSTFLLLLAVGERYAHGGKVFAGRLDVSKISS